MTKIHDFVVKYIVGDVPDALSACLDCGFVECLNEKWESCPNRLAREASLLAMRAAAAAEPAASGPPPELEDPAADPAATCPTHR